MMISRMRKMRKDADNDFDEVEHDGVKRKMKTRKRMTREAKVGEVEANPKPQTLNPK